MKTPKPKPMGNMIRCDDINMNVEMKDAKIVTRGEEGGPLYVVGPYYLDQIKDSEKSDKPCSKGEGLNFYDVSFEHGALNTGTFRFAVPSSFPVCQSIESVLFL